MKTAVIFDMDGLMVDTEPLSRRSWDLFLAPLGGKISDEIQAQIVGRRSDESSAIVKGALGLALSVAEIVAGKAAVYAELRAEGVPPMPGLFELHEQIARRNIPWGVATSSPRHHAEEILAQLGLREACGAIAGGDEAENGKPAPDIYLLAAERLGHDPQHCLALEDSLPGTMAAKAAGMTVIAIPAAEANLAAFGVADYVMGELGEVTAVLDRFFP